MVAGIAKKTSTDFVDKIVASVRAEPARQLVVEGRMETVGRGSCSTSYRFIATFGEMTHRDPDIYTHFHEDRESEKEEYISRRLNSLALAVSNVASEVKHSVTSNKAYFSLD